MLRARNRRAEGAATRRSRGVSISRYLAELIKEKVGADWPAGYFERVVGGWEGEPLERPAQGEFEPRDALGS
jgi:hypothetical protein